MKKTALIIISIFAISSFAYSQNVIYVKEKCYEGYIFSKEHSIWGFPPEKERYTLSPEDISRVEKILRDSINTYYVKSNQKAYIKPPINRKTLIKYMRQYVGYLTDSEEIVIWVNLFMKKNIGNQDPALDIISVQGGGYKFWSIHINITTKELSNMQVNEIS